MGIVGRKGKLCIGDDADLRDLAWQRYEDVLTADVFGAYRYLPTAIGILPVLERAVDEQRQSFPSYLLQFGISLADLDVARIRFWPTLEDGREPDVFVLLESTRTGSGVALLVEAKYASSQHEILTPTGSISQVGHYLTQHLADAYAEQSIVWSLPARPRPLLFITNHCEVPGSELARARKEACRIHTTIPVQEVGLFWVNWGTVGIEAQRLWRTHRQHVNHRPWLRMLLDLYEELHYRDLLPRRAFAGVPGPQFVASPKMYSRQYCGPPTPELRSSRVGLRSYTFEPAIRLPAQASR